MTDVLLGQSYYLRFDPKLWDAMQPFPPLGTLYAAAYLRRSGFSVAIFDAMLAASEAEWEAAVENHRPRLAVLFEDNFNYLSKMCLLRMRQAAFAMIAAARRQGCTVVAAGADATDHFEAYLDAGADFVVRGEGEVTLGELVGMLLQGVGNGFGEIRGLAWRENGKTIVNLPRPDIKDLDELPPPAWDLVDMERYRGIWLERHGRFAINLVTTRGCPFHCNWCAKPIWGQRYHLRSPEKVAAEIHSLSTTYHPDFIWFMDDIFGLKGGWTADFAQALDDAGVHLPFKCLSRADLLLRPGEVDALKAAGAEIVWIGAESGSQKILDAMDKGTRVEQIYTAADRLRRAGIAVGFFLQFGYPGEGLLEIAQTLQMVRDCRPDDIGISVSYPLPGTRFFESVHAQLGDQRNWLDSDDLAMLYRGPFTTEFYRQLHRVTHLEFRRDRDRRVWWNGRGISVEMRARALLKDIARTARLPVERGRLKWLSRRPHRPSPIAIGSLAPVQAAVPTPSEE